MINVGVVGYGYWGPNLARNFQHCPRTALHWICDTDPWRRERAAVTHPSARVVGEFDQLLRDKSLDLVVIATPVCTHHRLALEALQAGKHVLVEKPLARSLAEAEELVEAARAHGRILAVDHTFVYTSAVARIKQLVESGEIGKLIYYDSVRVNLGIVHHDVNVLWDLAVHDLCIMDHLFGRSPIRVSATGVALLGGQTEHVAYMTCYYEDRAIAHLHANWMSPVKIRKTIIGGEKRMIVYDDIEPSEKVKVYDRGIEMTEGDGREYNLQVQYRTGDLWVPHISNTEALRTEVEHLADCIEQGKTPLADGDAGLRVVRILEASSKSLIQSGVPVSIG